MSFLPWSLALLTAAHVGGALGATGGPDRVWPVPDHRVLSAFRPPAEAWGAGHRGVDLPAATEQVVRSVSAGVVGFTGSVAGKPVVTVLLADGRRLTYEPVRADVRSGEGVAPGDVLGTVADSGGHCGGEAGCLHLGLRSGATYLDPLALLPRGPAILKPWRSRRPQPGDARPRTWP